jgi:hypothetical protein
MTSAYYAFAHGCVKRKRRICAATALNRCRRQSCKKGFVLKDFIVRRAGGLIEAEVDGELIGLEVDQGLCYGFNGTATRIWALIEEPKRFSELEARLLEEYDVDRETCARELQALLEELQKDGLVAVEPLDA